jgi:prevent-host-death family protein
MTRWQLQEAKNRLSEVVRRARNEGPQVITLRGDDAVVVVAASDYQKLSRSPKGTLAQFLHNSPLSGVTLDLRRSRDTGRPVPL